MEPTRRITHARPGPTAIVDGHRFLLFAGPGIARDDLVAVYRSETDARERFRSHRLQHRSDGSWAKLAALDARGELRPLCWFGTVASAPESPPAPARSERGRRHRVLTALRRLVAPLAITPWAVLLLVLAAACGAQHQLETTAAEHSMVDSSAVDATTSSLRAGSRASTASTVDTTTAAATKTPARPTSTAEVDTVPRTSTTVRATTEVSPPQTPLTAPRTTVTTAPRRTDPYLPAGIYDDVFPPGTTAFEDLAKGNCGSLLKQIEVGKGSAPKSWKEGDVPDQLIRLYTAAAHACLSQWTPAVAAFQRITLPFDCGFDANGRPPWSTSFESNDDCRSVRMKVYDWTSSLLKAHASDPSFVPNFPTPPVP